jgi:hypothetical protein
VMGIRCREINLDLSLPLRFALISHRTALIRSG